MELLSHTSGKTSKQSLSLECWRKAKLPTRPAAAATGAARAGAPIADRDTSMHPWAVQRRRVSHSLQKTKRLFPVKGGAIYGTARPECFRLKAEGKGVPSADRWRPYSHDVHFKQSPANKLPVSRQCWLLNFDSQVVSFYAVNNEFSGVGPMFYSTKNIRSFWERLWGETKVLFLKKKKDGGGGVHISLYLYFQLWSSATSGRLPERPLSNHCHEMTGSPPMIVNPLAQQQYSKYKSLPLAE